MYHVIAFYKYVKMRGPKTFVKKHLDFCKSLGIRARILVGNEGINGIVCGSKEQIGAYKKELLKNQQLKDILFKYTTSEFLVFKGTWVRFRDQIVALDEKGISTKKGGMCLSPMQFKKMIETGKDVVLLDARNDYEWRVGKFKNAITLPIGNFREFPKAVKKVKSQLKGKKVLMYCTGGIRCEKASAIVKKEGIKDVYQVEGGIHAYVDEFPDTHWIGKLFVFDDRLAIDVNKKNTEPISNCDICKKSGDLVLDCSNKQCHEMFVACKKCKENFSGKCSKCVLHQIPVAC